MDKKSLYIAWGCLYILCTILGFIPEPAGFLYYLSIACSVVFFVPGFWLLYGAIVNHEKGTLAVIRGLSALSLGCTVLMFLLNVLSAGAGEAAGEMVHALLVILSTPMVCSRIWVLSLFLWACLLMGSILGPKKASRMDR